MPLFPGTIPAAQLPAATTSTQGAVILDGTASDIQPPGTQTAGAVGKAADAGHAHPGQGWILADNGLLAAAYDLHAATATQAMTAGNLYLVKIPIRQAITATFVWWDISGSASGASTGTFTGLYSSSGTLLSGSSDVAASLVAGPAKLTLTTPQSLSAGTFVWAALLVNLSSTQPTPFRSIPASFANLNLTAANYAAATNGSSLTSLPGSITPSSNSQGAAQYYWSALS